MARLLRADLLLRKGKGMMTIKRSLCEGDSLVRKLSTKAMRNEMLFLMSGDVV